MGAAIAMPCQARRRGPFGSRSSSEMVWARCLKPEKENIEKHLPVRPFASHTPVVVSRRGIASWKRGVVMRRGRLTRFKLADVQPCKKRMHHVLVSTLSRCAFVPSLSWQTFGVWHKTAFRIRREGVFRTIG